MSPDNTSNKLILLKFNKFPIYRLSILNYLSILIGILCPHIIDGNYKLKNASLPKKYSYRTYADIKKTFSEKEFEDLRDATRKILYMLNFSDLLFYMNKDSRLGNACS